MKNQNLLQSFIHAFTGLRNVFINERNFKIHVFAAVLVIFASFIFKLDAFSIAVVALAIGAVLTAELINTSIEAVVDLYCGKSLNPFAKIAKDSAAAAVLVSSFFAVIVGIFIFGGKILNLFTRGAL